MLMLLLLFKHLRIFGRILFECKKIDIFVDDIAKNYAEEINDETGYLND